MFLRSEPLRGYTLLSPTLLVMALAMGIPFGIMVMMSFWTQVGFEIDTAFTLANYNEAADRRIYKALLIRSLAISGACTVATVLLAYPMAYYVAFHVHRRKLLWIILMTLPFWTSYLLRVFAWKVILGFNGVINSGLKSLDLIDQPLEFLLYSPTAVVITLTHAWAAFAILPIYVSLEKIDRSLLEAAADLGEGPVGRFLRVTLPVGGPDGLMLANIIYSQFGRVNDWPMGAALAISMLLTVALVALVGMWISRKVREHFA
jgi:spermidine/putrescine transport system permease protein